MWDKEADFAVARLRYFPYSRYEQMSVIQIFKEFIDAISIFKLP